MGDRIYSLDTVKGIALLMVFFLHARWKYVGGTPIQEATGFLLLNLSRLAVPLFFLTSGYLLKMKLEKQETRKNEWRYVKNFAWKLGMYYIIGTGLFLSLKSLALFVNKYLNLQIVSSVVSFEFQWVRMLLRVFYTGKVGDHLWFLLALFYAVLIIYLFYRYDHLRELLIGAIILHIIAILSRAYMVMPWLPIPIEDVLFFGLVFTVTGFYVRKKELDKLKSAKFFLGAAIVMNVLHMLERVFLTFSFSEHAPYFWGNYSFLTVPAALTVFLYFLKKKELGQNWGINTYGSKTLWIYIMHPLTLGLLIAASELASTKIGFELMQSMTWAILITVVAYFGSAELIIDSSWRTELKEKSGKIHSKVSLT